MHTEVKIARGNELEKLVPVFRELRPHLSDIELKELVSALFEDGYRVIYIGDEKLAWSILGFRILTFLWTGKTLYIDDLATLTTHRKNGYATILFEWIKKHAKENDCMHLSLDSGFHRTDAYRFYLNQGLYVESIHFGRKVEEL